MNLNLHEETTLTETEITSKKIQLIKDILNYPVHENLSIEKKVAMFDKLYDLSLEDLSIYNMVYK